MRNFKNPITGKPQDTVLGEVRAIQQERANSDFGDEDSELSEVALALKALYGVLVQLLQREEEATSFNASEFLTVFQSSATQNTRYSSTVATLNGKCTGIFLSGTGNVSLYHYSPIYSPKGFISLGTYPLNAGSIYVPYRFPVHPQSYFAVSTDSSSNGVVSCTALLNPISLTGKDLYIVNNSPGQ